MTHFDLQSSSALLLVVAVVVVGILHTAVPDHWIPIALLARQHGWSKSETAWAAIRAGMGHALSTLIIGIAVWLIGASVAQRFGSVIDTVASLALVLFGASCAVMGLIELRGANTHHHQGHGREHSHSDGHHPHEDDHGMHHVHWHRHEGREPHTHMHAHSPTTAHAIAGAIALDPPFHDHSHRARGRGALLVILGSSPMIEGIPAFFAASRLGAGIIVVMAVLFAASTIATYVALCVYSAAGLQRASLGPLERYGEVLSGAFIALVGVVFWAWPIL
jgi:hypothetical protein